MTHRRIGQESFGFARDQGPWRSLLGDLSDLIDGRHVEHRLADISCPNRDEPARHPMGHPYRRRRRPLLAEG
ncbi:hypothetical protein [Paracoccus halophilus]|uniref:hypothetical protein n=1 Tax=Paracoccus halophilus TaxID=376733 RepID=UPI0011139D70|nr:hypothetical protein [Paracoccus halophilus]